MSSFININGSVCGPVTLSRRIKQGDSICSQLYIISIEPLLMRLRNKPFFQWITLPLDGTIELTAYADDDNLYVTQSSNINIINSILSTYQPVSNAKVNWTKSCGLKINGLDVELNCKLGISWNTKEQNFLGVFFGAADTIAKNWTLVEENVNSVIKSWTFFSKGLSFIGRVLAVNSLCASKLWYIISVLQPPHNYISSLQKVFIDFVWQGRHWIKSDILYSCKSHGGLGLVHILSRLHAFRLRFIHEYLYYDRHSCFMIANVFFRRVYNFRYSKQLFILVPVKYDVSNIPPFYQSLMNTWSLFPQQKVTPPT